MLTPESTRASMLTPDQPDALPRWRDRLVKVLLRVLLVFFGLYYMLLSIGLGLALLSTVQSGLVGIGRIHLLFTIILASLLLEPRHAVPFTVLAVTLMDIIS